MKFIEISKNYWVNPKMIQSVFLTNGNNRVYISFNYGVSEAPSIETVSTSTHESDYGLEETIKMIEEAYDK